MSENWRRDSWIGFGLFVLLILVLIVNPPAPYSFGAAWSQRVGFTALFLFAVLLFAIGLMFLASILPARLGRWVRRIGTVIGDFFFKTGPSDDYLKSDPDEKPKK